MACYLHVRAASATLHLLASAEISWLVVPSALQQHFNWTQWLESQHTLLLLESIVSLFPLFPLTDYVNL